MTLYIFNSDWNHSDILLELGHQQVKPFSWQKTAAQTLAVYRLVGG